MQFVKRKANSKFLHQMEKPRTRKTKEVYLECEDWLPAVVDFLNFTYDVYFPLNEEATGNEETEEEVKKNYVPAYFTYKCYDTDRGYILLWSKWFNIGELWSTEFEGLAGGVEVEEGEDIPPPSEVQKMAENTLQSLINKIDELYPEFYVKIFEHKTKTPLS